MNVSISRDGSELGDWPEEQVREYYREGRLLPTDFYWKEGMTEWAELSKMIKPPPPMAIKPTVIVPIPVAIPAPEIQALPMPSKELPNAASKVATKAVPKVPTKKQSWDDLTVRQKIITTCTMFFGLMGSIGGAAIAKITVQEYPSQGEYMFVGAFFCCVLVFIAWAISRIFTKTWKLRTILWVGGLVGAVAGLAISPYLIEKEFERALYQASAELNNKCPINIDSMTSLDSVTVEPGRVFTYHYSLHGNHTYDAAAVKKIMTPLLEKGVMENPKLKLYRDYGVKLGYDYSYDDGTFITSIVIDPIAINH